MVTTAMSVGKYSYRRSTMDEKELLEEEKVENQIPGEENEAGAETGTAEDGNEEAVENTESENEAAVESEPESENVENGDVDEQPVVEEQPVEEQPEQEKMLTQSQVNELVGKARAEGRAAAMKELYGRYGVNDDNEMNDVFGKGQGYDLLNDEYNALNGNFKSLSAENALLKSGVVQSRWDDVKAILGMKGMDVTVENIEAELPTHQEWKNMQSAAPMVNKELGEAELDGMLEANKPTQMAPTQPSTIRKLGSVVPESKVDEEEAETMKWFGVK